MGLGTKIKEALSGDHHDTHNTTTTPTSTSKPTESSTTNYKTPGSFPSDDVPQRHTDGKEYTPPHGTALSDAKWKATGGHTGSGTTGTGLSSTGTQRNRLSKGIDDYDSTDANNKSNITSGTNAGHHTRDSAVGIDEHQSKSGAYWGDMSQGGHGTATQDLPDRTLRGEDATGTSGLHHHGSTTTGTTGRQHETHLPGDQAVGGGTYNTSSAQHGHIGRDPTEDARFGDDFSETGGRHHGGATGGHRDHLTSLSGQPTGASSHNPLASGTNYSGQPTGASSHNPLSSGTNYSHQDTGFRGDGSSTSQHDRTGHGSGHGLAGAGATAGVGAAAGYGAHEYGQTKQTHTGHHAGSGSNDGVPRSSMLDPEPALGKNSGAQYSGHSPQTGSGVQHPGSGFNNNTSTRNTGYDDAEGSHGPHASRFANAADPRVDSDRDHRGAPNSGAGAGYAGGGQLSGTPAHINTSSSHNNNSSSSPGFGSSASPTQSTGASSGSGRKHFGPGHEGAKVLHSCEHCGHDNDISQYFSKDVVYRLGQQ